MKKTVLFFILVLFAAVNANSQNKLGDNAEFYGGIGYQMVFFTNTDVWKIYPIIDADNSSFLTEINPYIGVRINKSVAIELTPSVMFNKTYSKKGFYFSKNGVTNFYAPQNVRLISIPIAARVKYYPFASGRSNAEFLSGLYTGAGIGGAWISESYDNWIYKDETLQNNIGYGTSDYNTFRPLTQIFAGYDSFSKIGIGVEVGYRIIPLGVDREEPVISSIAPNFNSVFLNVKARFGF